MEKIEEEFENMKKNPENVNMVSKFTGDFSDMAISDIGFGKNEYKTSKPNILKNDAVVDEILNISAAAETAIGHTIGPYADGTLIQTQPDRNVPVYYTRDGFTILQNMKFTQPIPNGIFKIIREASEYMQSEVGDSTSSGIPIQHALLKKYIEIFNDTKQGKWTFSPVGIKNITNICVKNIIEGITDNKAYQKKFPEPNADGTYSKEDEDDIIKWLTKVATISANNDYVTGQQIAELYRDKLDGRGNVIVTMSKTEEEYSEGTNAFIVPVGPLDESRMNNSADHFTWEADKPLVAMFDGMLLETDLPALKQIVESVAFDFKQPLLLVASSYNYNIAQYLRECIEGTRYNELGEDIADPKSNPAAKPHKLNICAIILKNKEIEEQFRFSDLRLMTKSHPFSTELTKMTELSPDKNVRKQQLENMLGTCEHISSGKAETNFIGCKPDTEEFDALIKDLKSQAEKLKRIKHHRTDYTADDLFGRIDNLQARTTFYYCGGRSEKTKLSRRLVVEDAAAAVAAAIKSGGVSIGGNMAICHYIYNNFYELTDRVLDDIYKIKINITAAENFDNLKHIVEVILEAIEFAFGNAYRYALYNMYRDSTKAFKKWEECITSDSPVIYNIMSNQMEPFNCLDSEKCTTLIVPRNTDKCLLNIITETVSDLINVGNMITLFSPNIDVEEIQRRQLETGAAYMQR